MNEAKQEVRNLPDRVSQPEEGWTEIRPKRHLLDVNIRELVDYVDLLMMLVKRDVVTLYKQTILGPLWYFIQPIATTVVYLIVFSRIAHISTDGVPAVLFYLSGVIMWNYFTDCFNKTSLTFVANASIFGKVYFPRLIAPLSQVVSGLIKFLIQFALFLGIYIYYVFTEGLAPNLWTLATPCLLVLMAALGTGIGLIFSSLTTKYRDLTFVIGFGVQLGMYATPIIYPMSFLSERAQSFMWWNPVAHMIEAFRFAFLGAGLISISGLVYATLFSFTALALGVVVFNHTERNFMDSV